MVVQKIELENGQAWIIALPSGSQMQNTLIKQRKQKA